MPENQNTSTIFLFQYLFVFLLLLLCSCVSLLMPSAIAVSAQRHLPSRRPAFGTAHRMHIAYGLGPEAGSGVEHYLRDTTIDFHWDQYRRTAYNLTWRCMTPIFNIGPHTLWVGSQPAARDVQRLRSCDINQRLSALGRWGCQKAPGIRDMASFRMDDFLHDRSADAKQLQSVIRAMDSALRKGSLLVFCKQGCRRGPTLVGSYLMAKTRCAPGVVTGISHACASRWNAGSWGTWGGCKTIARFSTPIGKSQSCHRSRPPGPALRCQRQNKCPSVHKRALHVRPWARRQRSQRRAQQQPRVRKSQTPLRSPLQPKTHPPVQPELRGRPNR